MKNLKELLNEHLDEYYINESKDDISSKDFKDLMKQLPDLDWEDKWDKDSGDHEGEGYAEVDIEMETDRYYLTGTVSVFAVEEDDKGDRDTPGSDDFAVVKLSKLDYNIVDLDDDSEVTFSKKQESEFYKEITKAIY